MAPLPDRSALRATLSRFDDRRTKITGGVLAIMFRNPSQVRDREWISRQFCEVAGLAGEFEDLEQAQTYIQAEIHPILDACYALFQVVGEDLAPRVAEGLTTHDAMNQALSYFVMGAPDSGA